MEQATMFNLATRVGRRYQWFFRREDLPIRLRNTRNWPASATFAPMVQVRTPSHLVYILLGITANGHAVLSRHGYVVTPHLDIIEAVVD